jgi:hypothetical protein
MPPQISAEKRKEIEETFDVFDADKGGEIDSSEFRELMASLGVNLTDDQAREKLQVGHKESNKLKDAFRATVDCELIFIPCACWFLSFSVAHSPTSLIILAFFFSLLDPMRIRFSTQTTAAQYPRKSSWPGIRYSCTTPKTKKWVVCLSFESFKRDVWCTVETHFFILLCVTNYLILFCFSLFAGDLGGRVGGSAL